MQFLQAINVEQPDGDNRVVCSGRILRMVSVELRVGEASNHQGIEREVVSSDDENVVGSRSPADSTSLRHVANVGGQCSQVDVPTEKCARG